jgi:hypothetical protein
MTSPVKQAVDFVRAHPQQMTRTELDEFKQIADEVYLMAIEAGVVEAIPKVPELRPQLESQDPPLPPVQFESKLNLSGDWGTTTPDVYMVCAAPRWFEDMEMLSDLLKTKDGLQENRWNFEKALKVLLGKEAVEILNIARSNDKSCDTKMREICGIDRRCLSWDSPDWSDVLGRSEAAIRKTPFWKYDRQKAIEAENNLK